MQVKLIPIATSVALASSLVVSQAAIAQYSSYSTSPRSECIQSLLYPGGVRNYKVSLETAASACQNANTPISSNSVSSCVQSLLYPYGTRNYNMSYEAAANACRNASTPASSYGVSDCVQALMYPGGIRSYNIDAKQAASACRAPEQQIIIIQPW